VNFPKILELQFLDAVVSHQLQTLPNQSQLFVLKVLYQMTQPEVVHQDRD
jgi:hypothetical protein